ncbi:MAG: FAD-dependent monooxygenase [Actinobacteria bacterium]|nr:FAD-dependent monooxygenase [Actinomycetota bacterium]
MHDIVIVGSRCAGAPLAMLLAGKGHDVVVVDRATFPSDTMSTHFVQPAGMTRLAKWGLLDDVFATGCPPITTARMSTGPGEELELEIPLESALPGLAAPRRYLLDKILVDAAVAAGASLAQGVSIDSVIPDGDRIGGVRGHTADGAFEARGRIVVGADGRHSVIAREVAAPFVRDEGSTSAGYYTYYRGLEADGVETYFHDDVFCVVAPTNDELTLVGLAWRQERFADLRRDVEGNFVATLDRLGDIGERTRSAERAERFVGSAELPNYLRKATGPGWALVGDACYHKDPAPADGISDAFRGAEFLADAINEALSGGDETAAMADFERRHAEVAIPLLEAAVRVADFDNTPQQRLEAFIEIRMHDAQESAELVASTSDA